MSQFADDEAIRAQSRRYSSASPWADTSFLSILVDQGIVHLWGLVCSEEERQALRVTAEAVPGVRGVQDHS